MKKLLYVVLIIVLALLPSNAFANECVEPMAVKSPCEGVLLPPKAAEDSLRCLRVDVPKLNLEVQYLKDEKASIALFHKQLMQIESDRNKALEKQIEVLLKANTGPRWYESPAFHFAMGFVTASAVTIGITYAVNSN